MGEGELEIMIVEESRGANYYPGRPRSERVECVALIDIRPSRGNRSMSIEDPELRRRVLEIALARVVPEDQG